MSRAAAQLLLELSKGLGMVALIPCFALAVARPAFADGVDVTDDSRRAPLTRGAGFMESDWIRYGAWVLPVLGVGTGAWWLTQSRHRRSRARLERAHEQSSALLKISACASAARGDAGAAFRSITQTAAAVLKVARVGIWLMDEQGSELRCADAYDASRNAHASGARITAAACPRYFEALREERVMEVIDVRRDGRMTELGPSYPDPAGAISTIEAAVRTSGQFVGVLRFEHVGSARAWREDEVGFAAAVADQVAQGLLDAQRERAARELREVEERLALAAEAAHLGSWVWETASDRVWLSERCRELFGFARDVEVSYPDFLGRVHPDDRASLQEMRRSALSSLGHYDAEYRVLLSDGSVRWLFGRGAATAEKEGRAATLQGVVADVTPRKQAEARSTRQRNQLAHLARVAMLGELSGSLAHELNQPLTSILSNAQAAQHMLASDSPDLHEVREILADIVNEDKRAGEVIKRLRLLLKKGEVQRQELDLNEIVQDVLKIMRSDLIQHDVEVETHLADALPRIEGDPVQLQQVLLNLIVNGCDAMKQSAKSDRRLVVSTEPHDSDGVCLSVADRGCGIPNGRVNRIFEPFFTTKPHGMGLGLSVCKTIVAAHGGTLWATNNHGAGASFHLALPLHSTSLRHEVIYDGV